MTPTRFGTVGVLNVGAGDVKLSFDTTKPAEREHAAKVVTDMLARGYAILIQVGEEAGEPLYRRAKGFDPQTCAYLIVGAPEDMAEPSAIVSAPASDPPAPRRRGRPTGSRNRTQRVPAESTRAVAVHRSAGG